jgi:GH35 family endo-1,4-beta-xylanase
MMAGAGMLRPLWAAMKYDRDGVLDLFRLSAAETDARVRAGIEANRKGTLKILFKDGNGKPCETTHVKIRQKKHDFKYGANLFMLDEIVDSAEKNEAYKEHFAAAFNLATLPFYWSDVEPEEGKPRYAKDSPRVYRRPAPDLCVEWCEAHGIEPKAHCLNYVADFCSPGWAKGDVTREKQLLEKRFRELAARYAHRIPMWEVTNETLHWQKGRLDASSFYAEPDLVEWSFKTAERYFASNKLVINEGGGNAWGGPNAFSGTRSAYYMQIENALLKGCRIDSVGIQSHFWGDAKTAKSRAGRYYDPQFIFSYLDSYAQLGKPIQITEVTIPAYSNDPGDEAVQAELLRNFYRIWFSHPAMEAIIYWNVPDGYAHAATPGDFSKGENVYYGGLCRFDMTPKPAYDVIRELFGREWHTDLERDVSGGRMAFRGFHGTYEIEATSNGKTVTREFHLGPVNFSNVEVTI